MHIYIYISISLDSYNLQYYTHSTVKKKENARIAGMLNTVVKSQLVQSCDRPDMICDEFEEHSRKKDYNSSSRRTAR